MFKFLKKVAENQAVHPSASWLSLDIPRTDFDYSKEVGTGLGSSVIMSPVQWIMRTFPESPVRMEKVDGDDIEKISEHPFLNMINNPNPFYTYETMMMATLMSWNIAGNAYWIKVRSKMGEVVELWYVPHWMMTPKGSDADPSIFIDHYIYNPNGVPYRIEIEDVVHFRFGLNPENIRMGISPLDSVIREVFTDDEAGNYSASILRNMGVPCVIISPSSNDVDISQEQAKVIKEKFTQSFAGDNRGQALVMTGSTKVDTFGFDPKQLSLSDIRNISEERVCACLGIPAAVVGFGSGLEATKVGATMTAMIKLAWTGNIIPSQRIIAQVITKQLLIDFDDNDDLDVVFDNSRIVALQEDKSEKIRRLTDGVKSGWVRISEVRQAEGLPIDESDEIYLRPLNLVEIE